MNNNHTNDNETLEQLQDRLAKRSTAEKLETMAKGLSALANDFALRRKRKPAPLAKALRDNQRLVIPSGAKPLIKGGVVTDELFMKANTAFVRGVITGNQLNTVDVCRRSGFRLEDADLIRKIENV